MAYRLLFLIISKWILHRHWWKTLLCQKEMEQKDKGNYRPIWC